MKIKILTAIPLKQGLKLIALRSKKVGVLYFNSNSIKTRIETNSRDYSDGIPLLF